MRSLTRLFYLGLCLLPAFAWAQEPELDRKDPQDYVSSVFPYDLETVHDRIALLFNSDARDYYDDYNAAIYQLPEPVTNYKELSPKAYQRFLAFPLVRPNKFYVFFGAYPNMQRELTDLTPLAAMGHTNAALQRYAALPMEARARDIYLWSPDVPYWQSEYRIHGETVPFRSYFIVHLTPAGDGGTSVEIIENEPRVRLGKALSVDAHGTIHHDDIREVEPTTGDREFLLSCMRQFIDRNVPGRHWFNCRSPGEVVEQPVPFTVP